MWYPVDWLINSIRKASSSASWMRMFNATSLESSGGNTNYSGLGLHSVDGGSTLCRCPPVVELSAVITLKTRKVLTFYGVDRGGGLLYCKRTHLLPSIPEGMTPLVHWRLQGHSRFSMKLHARFASACRSSPYAGVMTVGINMFPERQRTTPWNVGGRNKQVFRTIRQYAQIPAANALQCNVCVFRG